MKAAPCARLALPPRLARMIVAAKENGEAGSRPKSRRDGLSAASAATIPTSARGSSVSAATVRRAPRMRAPRRWTSLKQAGGDAGDARRCGSRRGHLAAAFPDRIAKARGNPGEFLMANGRAAALEPHDPLAREPYLAIAEISGRAAAARILLAAPLESLAEIEAVAGDGDRDARGGGARFPCPRDHRAGRKQRRLGALVLDRTESERGGWSRRGANLAEGIAARGFARLPWTQGPAQWRDRVAFPARERRRSAWPDLSDEALRPAPATGSRLHRGQGEAFGDHIKAVTSRRPCKRFCLSTCRAARGGGADRIETPAGSRIAVDYAAESGPTALGAACRSFTGSRIIRRWPEARCR